MANIICIVCPKGCRLTVDEVVDKLLSLEYVKEELAALGK